LPLQEEEVEEKKKTGALAKSALFTATLIWGSSFIIVKDVTNVWPSGFLLAFRFTAAFILLCIIFHKRLRIINKDYLFSGGIIGLMLFLAYYTQTLGITDTTPGKNAFLTAIYCVLVPFLFWAVDKSKPDKFNILSALICITGIGLVSLTEKFTIGFGDTLTLIGGFFYAAHLVCIAKFSRGKDPLLISILQFGFAAIFSWVLTLTAETLPTDFSLPVLSGVLYLSILCTAVALTLQNFGQKYTNPSAAAIILSFESVFGVIFSVIFYHEVLTVKIVIGFALIFLAVLISETKLSFLKRKTSKPLS
jgi:drug/metabolite transporter (DMT)-like permease